MARPAAQPRLPLPLKQLAESQLPRLGRRLGVAQAGELFFGPVRRTFDEYAGLAFIRRCEIVPARLGPLAGLSGAAALVLDDV